MINNTQAAIEALEGLEFQFSKLSDKDWTATFQIIQAALQSKPVDVGTLLDMVERAEEDMVIGAERHQSGTIDGNRELARSGIRYMEKAKPYIDLLETLADIEHERWSGWMRYFYENNTPENNERWKKQMITPYKDLPEHSKESDRREVRKTLAALNTPPQSPVTKEEAREAFDDFDNQIAQQNTELWNDTIETIRKCLQAAG